MQINYILLGQRIRAFRTKKGITQMELAERIDRSAAYMSYVETAYKSQGSACGNQRLRRYLRELGRRHEEKSYPLPLFHPDVQRTSIPGNPSPCPLPFYR